jgi:hypothetical protein
MFEDLEQVNPGAGGGRYHKVAITRYLRRAPQADATGVAHQLLRKTNKQANQGGGPMFGARHASAGRDCFHSEATPGRDRYTGASMT